ncbi:MAG: hypothetical protein KAH84_10015 [Thiomargarita sp.]|nr:hypothetical protein [Thiomargarita sp.]
MTDNELKELVAGLAIAQSKTDKLIDKMSKEADERFKESNERFDKTDKLIDKMAKESNERFDKTDKLISKISKELGKQIGGLGNKFGSFTEGMAFPSMSKVLKEHFNMEVVSTRVKAEHGNKKLELDVLAYANGKLNTAFIVEVKSHVKQDDLQQLLKILANFSKVFPEHAAKLLYAILAYVDMLDNVKEKILEHGIYLARINDEHFKLQIPDNFQVQSFNPVV